MDERRIQDERFRVNISERLSAIETSQKLYHAEIKSIIENIFKETADMKEELQALHHTIYGGPEADNVGLLERFRALLLKAGIYTSIAVTIISFVFKVTGNDLLKSFLQYIK